jgi:hypothetical protein
LLKPRPQHRQHDASREVRFVDRFRPRDNGGPHGFRVAASTKHEHETAPHYDAPDALFHNVAAPLLHPQRRRQPFKPDARRWRTRLQYGQQLRSESGGTSALRSRLKCR